MWEAHTQISHFLNIITHMSNQFLKLDDGYMGVHYTILSILFIFEILLIKGLK